METTTDLKKRIYHYIEQADERLLRMIHAMLDQDDKTVVAYTTDGKPLTKLEYKQELAQSEKEIEQGEVISQEDLEKEVRQW